MKRDGYLMLICSTIVNTLCEVELASVGSYLLCQRVSSVACED